MSPLSQPVLGTWDMSPHTGESDAFGYKLLFVYLFIEYVRPMDFIPGLGLLKPGLVISCLLMLSWVTTGNLSRVFDFRKQIKYTWLFIILMATSVSFARNTHFAFFTALTVLGYMPFMLSCILYLSSLERVQAFFRVWIYLLLFLAVKGIVFHGKGGSSFLSDENDFSLLMNMMIPFAYFFCLHVQKGWERTLYLAAAGLGAVSVVASSSRGGFVGLVVVGGIMWWFSPRKLVAIAVLGIVAVLVAAFADPKYWEEMGTITDTSEATASSRIDSWTAAWEMFKDNPWGVGAANFPFNFAEYQGGLAFKREMWGRAAHSLWFTLLSELGVIGTLLFLTIIWQHWKDLRWVQKVNKDQAGPRRVLYFLSLAFLGSLAGFFVSGTFLSVLYYPHFYYLTALIVATVKLSQKLEREGLRRNGHNAVTG